MNWATGSVKYLWKRALKCLPIRHQGFLRTIDITIKVLPTEKLSNEGWQLLF
jgi:hypothetical protein